MPSRLIVFLQVIAFAVMIFMNALANSLPLNGYTTGQLSGFYPNRFVPAGFTFAIWGVIYLLLLVWLIGSSVYLWKNDPHHPAFRHARLLAPFFIISSVFNSLWIVAWHYLYVSGSLLIMLALLVTLIRAYRSLQQDRAAISGFNWFILYAPFVVYLAWISVATIANTTALLVHLEWTGGGLSEDVWSAIMIVIAAGLSAWFGLYKGELAFTLVTAWAFWGIYKGQLAASELAGSVALAACIGSLAAGSYGWWRTRNNAPIDGVL